MQSIESRHQNTDPITGDFQLDEVNPDFLGNVRERKSVNRRGFLTLFFGGGGAVATALVLEACGIKLSDIPTPEAPPSTPTGAGNQVEPTRSIGDITPTPDRSGPLFTPETGKYNAEALKLWQKLEKQPKLDPKLDIAMIPSRYVRGEAAYPWHADVATKLGFQSVSIAISPPELQNHIGINGNGVPLDKLIKTSYHDYVFSHPDIKRIHVTCDVGNPEAANGWKFPGPDFTDEQLWSTYDEYFRFCSIILKKYGSSGKEIIIGGPNELELLCKGGYSAGAEDSDISEQSLKNAIAYCNVVHKAVRNANGLHTNKKPLRTSMEVLQIRSEWDRPNARTGLDIAAGLEYPPDEISLSAWQVAGKGQEGYLASAAMKLMQNEVPGSTVAISEFGIADRDRPELNRDQVAQLNREGIVAALKAGATRVTMWALTCFNSDKNFPNNDETRGLGLIRPDGSIRMEVYNVLRELSGVAKVA